MTRDGFHEHPLTMKALKKIDSPQQMKLKRCSHLLCRENEIVRGDQHAKFCADCCTDLLAILFFRKSV